MNIETRQAYSEVNNFLEVIDKEMSDKIPKKLRNYFKREMDKDYIPKINPEIPIKSQNLRRKTIAIISGLNLQYWCNEEEKQKLLQIYSNNEKNYQAELREKYNPDNLFKKQKNYVQNLENNTITEETTIVEYKEKNFLQKIFDKIKRLFKKN